VCPTGAALEAFTHGPAEIGWVAHDLVVPRRADSGHGRASALATQTASAQIAIPTGLEPTGTVSMMLLLSASISITAPRSGNVTIRSPSWCANKERCRRIERWDCAGTKSGAGQFRFAICRVMVASRAPAPAVYCSTEMLGSAIINPPRLSVHV